MQHSTLGLQQPTPKSPAIATIAALCIAILSIASAAILVRLSEQEINPYATAFNRFWITTLLLSVWNGVGGLWQHFKPISRAFPTTNAALQAPGLPVKPFLHWATLGQLLLMGAFVAGDLMLWAWSLTQTSVANATLLANLTPVFSCIGGWLFLGKRFDRRFVTGMAVAIAAVGLIGVDDSQVALGKFAGDAAALVAAVSFSFYLAIVERLQDRFSTQALLFWSSAMASLVSLPVALFAGGSLFPVTLQGWLAVIALAVMCQLLGQGMLVHSMNQLSTEFVALFLLLEPILAGVGAWLLFGEQLSILNLMAFAIALMGIYLSMSSPSAVRNESEPVYLGELTVELAPVTATSEEVTTI